MKGQVSTELMVIIGLVLIMFIPMLVLVYFKASDSNQQIASYQAELAVFRLAYLSNSVGSLGSNAAVSTDLFIPKNTISFETKTSGKGGEIVLTIDTPQGPTSITEIVKYPLSNSVIADSVTAGSWVRLKISSEPTTNSVSRIRIEKTN